jgi:hypothetical protein
MDQRAFLGTLTLLAAPRAAEAQQASAMSRIGVLSPSAPSDPRMQRRLEAFRQGLRELGYAHARRLRRRLRQGRADSERDDGQPAQHRTAVDTRPASQDAWMVAPVRSGSAWGEGSEKGTAALAPKGIRPAPPAWSTAANARRDRPPARRGACAASPAPPRALALLPSTATGSPGGAPERVVVDEGDEGEEERLGRARRGAPATGGARGRAGRRFESARVSAFVVVVATPIVSRAEGTAEDTAGHGPVRPASCGRGRIAAPSSPVAVSGAGHPSRGRPPCES